MSSSTRGTMISTVFCSTWALSVTGKSGRIQTQSTGRCTPSRLNWALGGPLTSWAVPTSLLMCTRLISKWPSLASSSLWADACSQHATRSEIDQWAAMLCSHGGSKPQTTSSTGICWTHAASTYTARRCFIRCADLVQRTPGVSIARFMRRSKMLTQAFQHSDLCRLGLILAIRTTYVFQTLRYMANQRIGRLGNFENQIRIEHNWLSFDFNE